MVTRKQQNSIKLIVLFLLSVVLFSNCTKEGTNAVLVSRALVDVPDSTVFSPFYDSTVVINADDKPGVNDIAVTKGVFNIIYNNCASLSCHGGRIAPTLTNYEAIKALVVPGNPEASKLFQMITTSDLNKAMPPINYGVDLSVTDKTKIYNWIRHGAKDAPTFDDFKPAAIALITNGCTSANCHNGATIGGEWARRNLITYSSSDTVNFQYINPTTGGITNYCQLKEPVLSKVMKEYRDSCLKFYSDTVANASFRPFKTYTSPVIAASRRGPLSNYEDIMLDILIPKSVRSNTSVVYTDPTTGKRFYARGDALNAASTMLSRVDSTLVVANVRTGVYNPKHHGEMAYDDGGLSPSEIAQIKAWYFMDPNIPDVWKYGLNNTGIFKYRKTGKVIVKK
jgi:hypothetical protein